MCRGEAAVEAADSSIILMAPRITLAGFREREKKKARDREERDVARYERRHLNRRSKSSCRLNGGKGRRQEAMSTDPNSSITQRRFWGKVGVGPVG